MQTLFGRTIDLLSDAIDFRSERHKIITSNIVNIDTPKYKSKELIFKKELEDLMVKIEKTNEKHLSTISDSNGRDQYEVMDTSEAVNIDAEMANLAENHLMHNLSVELIKRKFTSLKDVLREVK